MTRDRRARQQNVVHKPDAADRLLIKLRRFAADDLDSDERVLLGVLLTPAVLAATEVDEVEGFESSGIGNRTLARSLHAALRRSPLRVVGLEDKPAIRQDP